MGLVGQQKGAGEEGGVEYISFSKKIGKNQWFSLKSVLRNPLGSGKIVAQGRLFSAQNSKPAPEAEPACWRQSHHCFSLQVPWQLQEETLPCSPQTHCLHGMAQLCSLHTLKAHSWPEPNRFKHVSRLTGWPEPSRFKHVPGSNYPSSRCQGPALQDHYSLSKNRFLCSLPLSTKALLLS